MDKTPKDIINQTIIIESKLLLKRTNANISEVAALVGF